MNDGCWRLNTEEKLNQLIFLLDPGKKHPSAGEKTELAGLETNVYSCRDSGVLSNILQEACGSAEERAYTLFVTDAGWIYRELNRSGCPAAGYLHAGNTGESFRGAPYVIEEPEEIDRDSYEKIWQRASGRPWIIAETKRLFIREMIPEDLESLYLLYEDAQTRCFLEPLSENREKEKALLEAYIKKVYPFYGYGLWAVCRRTDGAMIGRVGLSPCQKGGDAVELGYLIRHDLRKKGFAAEAGAAVLNFARWELMLREVDLYTDPENEASRRTAKALGFVLTESAGNLERWRIRWDD
jgi:[ribosomal protein S5]-alanine N-acetyltransferase